MQQPIRIISHANKRLYADAIPGHFATNHSHINYYVDMSEIKHNMSMALEAARSIAFHFSAVSVDTLLCLEGTEYIGAYLARELSSSGIGSLNFGKSVYLVEPDNNVNGQFMFADNLRPMIENRNVLVLVNTASTGQTLSQTRECIEYYGGRVAGYSALFPTFPSWTTSRSSACFRARISRITIILSAARTAPRARPASRWTLSSPRADTPSCKPVWRHPSVKRRRIQRKRPEGINPPAFPYRSFAVGSNRLSGNARAARRPPHPRPGAAAACR